MKKKILCLGLSALVASVSAFSLAGCGGDGRIKVTIGMWPDATSPQDVAMYEAWEAKFEADYPEYDIVGEPYVYSQDTVTSKGMSKSLPTVFQTYFTEPEFLINSRYIADVTDELEELGWLDKMDDYMREAVSDANGRVYGVPRDGYGLGLFLNLEMLFDVGVIGYDADADNPYVEGGKGEYILYDEDGAPLYPTTFDELREVSEKIVDSYANSYGMVILSANKNGGWQFSNMAWNFGCESLQVQNADGTWSANLNDPAAVEALQWIQQMRQDGLVYPLATASYNDWFTRIAAKNVAMAFCGSDALMQPVTNSNNFSKDNIAFVPMPTGDGDSRYSLYGGTPYVFASSATKEQIKGALLFLKYMGRSPEVDDIAVDAMELGHTTAIAKRMPVIPTIKAWKNEDYLETANALEKKYCNVNLTYYQDFFDSIEEMKRPEEPNNCQDMYEILDKALQNVLDEKTCYTADCTSLLTTASNDFYNRFLSKIK